MPRLSHIASFCLALGFGAQPVLAADAASPNKVSFYFVAHEDDWQLFMNPSAFQDVVDGGTKTVFVHTTAGDAGLGTGNGGRKQPYYLARENGAESAIRFMADSSEYPREISTSHVTFNGHLLFRTSYRNTVAYFLRSPDGHPSGSGFESTGRQSLERLATGQIATLTAVDGSTIYRGWSDFVTTVHQLMKFELGSASVFQLNVPELDATINPGDHSDHRMSAKAALDAAGDLPCARRRYFVEYASAKLPENLDAPQRDMESSVVAVTSSGIMALDHSSIWRPYYQSYLGRNYFRADDGVGRCGSPTAELPQKANLTVNPIAGSGRTRK